MNGRFGVFVIEPPVIIAGSSDELLYFISFSDYISFLSASERSVSVLA
jgi:hypothetical protein